MPEMPGGIGGERAEPALALNRSALPAGDLGRLATGQTLSARVVRQTGPGRFLVAMAGTQVPVESRLDLAPGTQLSLQVRQAGARILLDLVGTAPAAGTPAPSPAPSGTAAAPAAAQLMAADVRALLAGTPGLGEAFAEISALLEAPAPSAAAQLAAALAEMTRPPADGQALAAQAETLPARLTELLRDIEALAARLLAELPGAAALDALLNALATESPAGTAAGPAADLAALLERTVAASRQARDGLPPEILAEVRALSADQRAQLAELAAARERALAAASPELAWLGRAHRALSAAEDRTGLWRSAGLGLSGQDSTFRYAEIPIAGGGRGSARLRVLVTRGGAGRGGPQGQAREPRRPVRAVLDLSLSELGEVWTEMVLTGQDLAARFELPDAQRRDFVAAALPELAARLEARGLRPALRAERRPAVPAEALAARSWPDGAASGGLDLWA